MIPAFYQVCSEMISRWEKLVSLEGAIELDVWPYLKHLTADGISQTAFGSTYEEGRRIFQLQTELVDLTMKVELSNFIPGWRYTYLINVKNKNYYMIVASMCLIVDA